MLPEAQDRVTEFAELAILASVPCDVPLDLVGPPICISLWRYVAPGTTMPEASVDEDHDGMFAKDEVG
jgi:hypothetical protein